MNFAHHVDPANREAWAELMTPRSVGLILKKIEVDFKFVSPLAPARCLFGLS